MEKNNLFCAYHLEMTAAGEEILPKFDSNNIPIVLSSNDVNVPFCAVTIQSILDCISDERNYDIFILTSDVRRDQREMLESMIAPYPNVSLRLVDMDGVLSQYNYPHVTEEIYFRLMIPWILKNFPRVIFVDGDTIFKNDPGQLLEVDLKSYYVAASRDIVVAAFVNGFHQEFIPYIVDFLGLECPLDYFNAGLMVLNCEEIRADFTPEHFFDDMGSHEYTLGDQDALNKAFRGHVYFLTLEWNMPPDSYVGIAGDGMRKSEYICHAPEEMQALYAKAHANPMAIHYTDTGKPWYYPDDDLADAFWETARRTPFYEPIFFRLLHFQAQQKSGQLPAVVKPVQYYPQGKLIKRTIKRIIRIFLPYGTKRRAFIKKIYFRLRRWQY